MALIESSELILNKDGSIYHLHLSPGEVAKNIILVGDPGRVSLVSSYFDKIELQRHNREIITHTGIYKNKRFTVLSTGMGTDNIDIVINELDALFNIDLQKREIKQQHTTLNMVRIGTSGALQPGVPSDSTVISTHGLGLDGMLYYYSGLEKVMDNEMTQSFINQLSWNGSLPRPYIVGGDEMMISILGEGFIHGITATAPGFYGPQGRKLRLETTLPDLNEAIAAFRHGDKRVVNFEMETSALYGLGKMLGHNTATLTNIVANRVDKTYSKDYHPHMKKLIETVLDRMTLLD